MPRVNQELESTLLEPETEIVEEPEAEIVESSPKSSIFYPPKTVSLPWEARVKAWEPVGDILDQNKSKQ